MSRLPALVTLFGSALSAPLPRQAPSGRGAQTMRPRRLRQPRLPHLPRTHRIDYDMPELACPPRPHNLSVCYNPDRCHVDRYYQEVLTCWPHHKAAQQGQRIVIIRWTIVSSFSRRENGTSRQPLWWMRRFRREIDVSASQHPPSKRFATPASERAYPCASCRTCWWIAVARVQRLRAITFAWSVRARWHLLQQLNPTTYAPRR